MPYAIRHRKDKFVVINSETGDVKGTHDTRKDAIAQLRALYFHVRDAHKALSGKSIYLTISKRDEEEHIVEGYASAENVDLQAGIWKGQRYEGDVVSAEAMQDALTEYMRWGNVREQHDDTSAVGHVLAAKVIKGVVDLDGEKLINPTWLRVKISDPITWQKVKDQVLKGFSIQADVYNLEITKMFGKVVRLIKSIFLKEISLVDRPANPVAQIVLWKSLKGEHMTVPKERPIANVSKADPKAAVASLQELRDAAELEGDLEKAQSYSDAIALALQAEGAQIKVVAEDADEAEQEHGELGAESSEGDEAGGNTEEEGDTAPQHETPEEKQDELDMSSLDGEQNAAAEEEPKGEDKGKQDEEEEKKDEKKKSLSSAADPKAKAAVKKAVRRAVETISKAEFDSLTARVQAAEKEVATLRKALPSDIAAITKNLNDVIEYLNNAKARPVLREIALADSKRASSEEVQVMKGLLEKTTDPHEQEILRHRLALEEIKDAQQSPNQITFNR